MAAVETTFNSSTTTHPNRLSSTTTPTPEFNSSTTANKTHLYIAKYTTPPESNPTTNANQNLNSHSQLIDSNAPLKENRTPNGNPVTCEYRTALGRNQCECTFYAIEITWEFCLDSKEESEDSPIETLHQNEKKIVKTQIQPTTQLN